MKKVAQVAATGLSQGFARLQGFRPDPGRGERGGSAPPESCTAYMRQSSEGRPSE
jgi:hypothetical protein